MKTNTKTAWIAITVDGGDQPAEFYAYNRDTRRLVAFDTLKEAQQFANHPDNRKD